MKSPVLYIYITLFFLVDRINAQQQIPPKPISYNDTVFMMNGDILPAFITDTGFFGVKLLKPDKKKVLKKSLLKEI